MVQEGGSEIRSIFTDGRAPGCYELAEAYKKQTMNSKAKGQFTMELLMDLA